MRNGDSRSDGIESSGARVTSGRAPARRDVVKALAGGGAAATVAGCLGDGNGTTNRTATPTQWVTGEGKPVELEINIKGSYGKERKAPLNLAAQTMRDEGIEATVRNVQESTFWPNTKAGEYQMSLNPSIGNNAKTVYTRYQGEYTSEWAKGYQAPGAGVGTSFEIPAVGDVGGEPSMTVDDELINDLLSDLAAADGEEQTELVQKLAWITNQLVPGVPNKYNVEGGGAIPGAVPPGDITEWDWTWEMGEPRAQLGGRYQALHYGVYRAKKKNGEFIDENSNAENGGILDLNTGSSFQSPDWNTYNPVKSQLNTLNVIFSKPMAFSSADLQWYLHLFEEYTRSDDGTTIEFTIDDRFTWHNGDPLTARDFEIKYGLGKALQTGTWKNLLESHAAVDETTYRVTLQNPIPEQVVFQSMFGGFDTVMDTPRSEYGRFMERLEDGEAREDVTADLVDFRYQDPVGTGPFQFDAINGPVCKLVRFDDHPYATQLNFEQVHVHFHQNTQQFTAELRNGLIDWPINMGNVGDFNTEENSRWKEKRTKLRERLRNENPDLVTEPNARVGTRMGFNYGDPIVGDIHVRKGIAYLMNPVEMMVISGDIDPADRPIEVGEVTSDSVMPEHASTFLQPFFYDEYSIGDVQFEDYGLNESKVQKAREQFRMAGWEKQ